VKVYIVYCHPDRESLTGAALERVMAGLQQGGHSIRLSDLYADGFDPALSAVERANQLVDHREHPEVRPALQGYIDDLTWCDTLVLVYPTWWGGQPAMLKGWFDRVWVTGVVYEAPAGKNRITSLLHNVQRIVVVTTHGSPKRVNALQGEPGKRTVTRSLRALCNRWCRTDWISLYDVDRATPDDCRRFLDRVEHHMARMRTRRQANAPA
jgi:putative NADPH-quinone reductase